MLDLGTTQDSIHNVLEQCLSRTGSLRPGGGGSDATSGIGWVLDILEGVSYYQVEHLKLVGRS